MSNYLLRGTAVALAEFVLVYAVAWLLVALGWKLWTRDSRRLDRAGAGVLYGLQLAPLLVAWALVGTIAIPAFMELEPHGGEEGIGLPVEILAAFCAMLFALDERCTGVPWGPGLLLVARKPGRSRGWT